MSNLVPGEGPEHARIMLIAEAPGETEDKLGRPFVGQAGKVLDGILEEVGLRREDLYITNVMQVRPAGNNFDNFYIKEKGKKVPSPDLVAGYERLQQEIASCGANVIVPLGNEALKAIAGFGGISKWRGSVLSTNMGKCIPSIHPASVARNWSQRPAVVSDFTRIKKESEYPDVRSVPKSITIAYGLQDALDAISLANRSKHVAFDIETETDQITCISLSWQANQGVCIPFWFAGSTLRTSADELLIWESLVELLGNPDVGKIGHNGTYDMEFLHRTLGIRVQQYAFDTMLGFHTLYLELPKGLDFICSIYTDVPYYKDDIDSEDMDTYFRYNATDSMVTYLCYLAILEELTERELLVFYHTHVHRLIFPLLDMQLRGVAFDTEKRNGVRKMVREDIEILKDKFEFVAPGVNPASPLKLMAYYYATLSYPKQTHKDPITGLNKVTVNEEALAKLAKMFPQDESIATLLLLREKSKLLSTYLEVKLDADNRIRCSYNITGTETGRLSSSATSRETGTNLQNIPNGVIKQLFLADPGKILLNADLSQAEARVVAYLAGDERLIRVFENGGDIHRKNAANIFKKKEEEVTEDERQLAKRVVHASNYGMGPATFSRNTGIPVSEAKRLLNQYFATYPRIKVWHMQISNQLKNSRRLRAPSGRERVFFNRWDESLTKEGLAYIPQETVGTLVNDALIELWEDKSHPLELLLQVHDSILCQCPEDRVEESIARLKKSLTRPIQVNGRTLVIPIDIKKGYNWAQMEKSIDQDDIIRDATVKGMGC